MFRRAQVLAPDRRKGRGAPSRQKREEALAGDRFPEGPGENIDSTAVHGCNLCAAMWQAGLARAMRTGLLLIDRSVYQIVMFDVIG
jgi:hypothetical protein